MRLCLYCNKELDKKRKIYYKAKYCNNYCRSRQTEKEKLALWKSGNHVGWTGKTIGLSVFIRKYLIEKFGNECSGCGWNKVHPITNKVPLEINHKDGNPKNCVEENLEVLCPNCHSLTPNFRALNKVSPRNRKG